jgi:hypothetical protein
MQLKDDLFLISAPFKRRGKKLLSKTDFIFCLSFDLGWYSKDEAEIVLENGINQKLLVEEEEKLRPNFDPGSIDIPENFSPGVFYRILRKIREKEENPFELLERKQKMFGNLIQRDVVAILVARELGVDFSDFIQDVWNSILRSA